MGSVGLVLRRARAGAALLLTIVALATVATAIIAGTLGYSQAAATTAAREALTGSDPRESAVRAQTRLASEEESRPVQDATARRIITETFAPAAVTAQRTVVSEPRPVAGQEQDLVAWAGDWLGPDGEDPAVEVVAGSWPDTGDGAGAGDGAAVPGALHAGAADLWGLVVGDELEVGGTTVTVAALWRPLDPAQPRWFGDALVDTGAVDGEVGPLVLGETAVADLGPAPFVHWTVRPDPDRVEPAHMAGLAGAAEALQEALKVPEVDNRGVLVEGDLAPTTATAARNLATAQALGVIPVVLLLLVSVIAVVQIARLQAAARTSDVEVLVARGASRRQLLVWSLLESLVVAVVATLLGLAVALAVVAAVPAGDQQAPTLVRAALGTGLALLLALVGVSALQVRGVAARAATDRSGRARQATTLAVLLLVPAATLLSWWQLDRAGSPLVTDEDGRLATDLLAGAAPALLLATAGVLAMAALGPLTRGAELVTRPRRRLTGHLAAAQVSRRLVVHAVPVVLTVLAVGASTLSGLYAATSGGLRDALSDVSQGADVRARLAPAPTPQDTLVTLPDVADVPHTARAPVWRAETRLGQTDAQLTVLPVDRLEEVALLPDGSLDPTAVTAALRPGGTEDPGEDGRDAIALPDGPLSLELTVSVTTRAHPDFVRSMQQQGEAHERALRENPGEVVVGGADDISEEMIEDLIAENWRWLATLGRGGHELRPTLQVVDPHTVGPQTLTLETLPFPFHWDVIERQVRAEERTETATLRLDLPDGTDRALTGLGLGLPQWSVAYDVTLTLEELTTPEGTDLLAQGPAVDWSAPEPAGRPAGRADYLEGPGSTDLEVAHDTSRGALVVSGTSGMAGTPPTPGRDAVDTVPVTTDPDSEEPVVPVAVTPALARANDLAEGQQVELRAFGISVPGTVAALVPSVPGTLEPEAALVDQAALADYLMATGQQAPRPTEVWFATEDPDATQRALAGVPGLGQVLGPGSVEVTDAASAVRLVFWVASAGAVLLAATGIAAVTATLLSGRRPEVAVLRALGAPAAMQARSRALELLGVVCAALLAGLAAGWAVGALVVPELARSTTLPGQVSLPAPLALELPLWLLLLGVLVLAVAITATVTATRVRAQALDSEYREEIR